MKRKPTFFIIIGLCATGLLTGFAAKRFTRGPAVPNGTDSADQNDRVRLPSEKPSAAAIEAGSGRQPVAPAIPANRSTDTVESLLAADEATLYGRLARWMTTASEDDVAAYWTGYKQKPKRSNDITDLVFLNWSRLNPEGAIAANAGSKEEHYAWWAWACHDPKRALAAALAANPDRVNNVAWGIGEFHPEYLREHFKELPEDARSNAIRGMMKWDDGQSPLDSLKFMKEIGYGANSGTLKALVRQDPWAALDWVRQNPGNGGMSSYGEYIQDPMQLVVKTMADEHPEDLERLAAQTPSGQLKLKMEAALFDNLLKTDPTAALEQAKATTVPRTAAERYAAIGLGLVKTDPDQAYQIARDLFAACPDALNMYAMVDYPNGSSGSGITIAGVSEFTDSLVAKDPAKTLELTLGLPVGRHGNTAFQSLSQQWVQRDLLGYTDWVNQQTDQTIHDQGANLVSNQLQSDGNFAEALEWRMSTKNNDGNLGFVLNQWKQVDPDEANEWLEAANLSADQKAQLKATMDQQH